MWIRSHVEMLLAQEWQLCRITADDDGDYVFPSGTALCWVSVLEGEVPMVRVTAHAAYGIRSSAKVLRELNDIQARLLSASIRLAGDVVVVSQTLSPIGLTQPVLAQALAAVGGVAADIGPLLAAVFDGATPLDQAAADAAEAGGADQSDVA